MRQNHPAPPGQHAPAGSAGPGEGEIAHGQYRVKGDEWFLQGHFPDAPVVPGVILCEILAQSAGILMQDSLTEDTIPMYTSMKNVRFRAPVLPGGPL